MKSKAAILPYWRRGSRMRVGQRAVTMIRPQCRICQRAENVPNDWYAECPHDPYISLRTTKTKRPKVVEVDGRNIIQGVEEEITFEARPNAVEVALTMRVNSGRGVDKARNKGFILPSELRSPHFPDGIVDPCQFRGCRKQEGLTEYRNGTFCRGDEAALVEVDESGEALEVGLFHPMSEARRRTQLLDALQRVRI